MQNHTTANHETCPSTGRAVPGRITQSMSETSGKASRKLPPPDISLSQLRRHLDVADLIYVSLDRNACIRLINRKGAELLCCPVGEILGRDWFDFVPPRIRETARWYYGSLISGESSGVDHFRRRAPV